MVLYLFYLICLLLFIQLTIQRLLVYQLYTLLIVFIIIDPNNDIVCNNHLKPSFYNW